MILIPIVASVCYLLGGQVNKLFRWLMGIPIFFIAIFNGAPWYSVFAIATYLIATNAFSYGDDSWTSKLFGRWVSMGLAGLTYGIASIVVLGAFWGIIQGILGCISFLILKYLDDNEILKNPWQELCRGLLGTILFVFA